MDVVGLVYMIMCMMMIGISKKSDDSFTILNEERVPNELRKVLIVHY